MSDASPRFIKIVAIRNPESETTIETDCLYGITSSGSVWRAPRAPKGSLQWTNLHAPDVMIDITVVQDTTRNWETAYALDRHGQIWELTLQPNPFFAGKEPHPFQWSRLP